MRKARGVYYTPEPVVSYIVRSINLILKKDFGLKGGVADAAKIKQTVIDPETKDKKEIEVHKVQILDPATGTGTFLYGLINQIHAAFKGNEGMWSGYVANHLLPRIFGFELLMAPYAVAHMKLGMLLKETGYKFDSDERLNVYLTNTLEEAQIVKQGKFTFAAKIAEEANQASRVKRDVPVMVVLGNPPYSGISINNNAWTEKLLKEKLPGENGAQSYFTIDGKPLGEKKVWLQDDYVKFIRYAQYRIERTGYGILAFISNHGYIDNPTFRGMRQSLMQTFDDIYILDLHGNANKKEICPDGSKDENVFDIMQGVSIGIFVRRKKQKEKCFVKHFDCFGTRDDKYTWLWDNEVDSTSWKNLNPNSPFYFYVPKKAAYNKEYASFFPIAEIIPLNVTGIVTARDEFVVDFTEQEIIERIKVFRDNSLNDNEIRNKYFANKGSSKYPHGDSRGWKLNESRKKVMNDKEWKTHSKNILYRPFDARKIYYVPWMVDWPRHEFMRNMLKGQNIAFCLAKGQEIGGGWEHVFSSRNMIQHHSLSLKEVNYIFPLYHYSFENENGYQRENGFGRAWPLSKRGRYPNISPEFIEECENRIRIKFVTEGKGDLKKTFGPEDVFHYIYAIFHSPTYRSRYAEFLKSDFPRVPTTSNKKLFAELCGLGAELVGLHLLENVPAPISNYPQRGDNTVEKPRYMDPKTGKNGRVYINKTQYFDNITPEVWKFQIGGYQVCEKWLKDRKGRELSYDDITNYQNIVTALENTIRIMAEIDKSIPKWPIE
jgi:predicted helicase